ncbi:hypothetical protein OS493_025629 [Desmophyllum pertusum]|uniref:Uncharacterized protein n=1 Tax=Desmophyllum pertusum TaxID=174260 RepID=A0A9W9ZYU8_9CNID|nr:hypothetical protein OS493_025629 [Desmophyllum pertusum]
MEVAERSTRGAVFFKCVRVDYDKEKGKLKLSEGEIVGHDVAPDRGGEDDKSRGDDDSLTEDDVKKLEIIKKAVLIPERAEESVNSG